MIEKKIMRPPKGYQYNDGKLYRLLHGELLLVLTSKEDRIAALHRAHSSDNSGHFGERKTSATLRDVGKVTWPNIWDDVKEYCLNCEVCQMRSSKDVKQNQPMKPIPFPKNAMRLIGVDLKKLPPTKDGFRYLAVAVDYHSNNFTRLLIKKLYTAE